MSTIESIEQVQSRLSALYSGDAFQIAAQRWASVLSEHFRKLAAREIPVQDWHSPATGESDARAFRDSLPADAQVAEAWLPKFGELVETMLSRGQNLHHPRYLGHQVPASLPVAALFDAIGTATNQVMAIYEMGPWATSVERSMIEQLGQEIGYPSGTFAGLVTSGGSVANLTALLTARNVALGAERNVWEHGIRDASRLALIVQADAHYCVARAAGILGIGTKQIAKVAIDEQRRMLPDSLEATIRELKQEGRTIVAVVACACATPTGAFDPLQQIAEICQRERVWFHVDAAHGGSALLSDQHRHLLTGIEQADSVVWDAHKMLFMPALCAFAFFRDKRHRFAAFEQNAPYLFDPSAPEMVEYDSGTQTLECTKRAAAYGLWGVWSLFGRTLFSDLVDVTFELTQRFHGTLEAASDFQTLHRPQCNIVAFRYLPKAIAEWSPDEQGDFQLRLRRQLLESGHAYLVPTRIDGVGTLRATLINPCTTEEDMAVVLDEVRRCGRAVLGTTGLAPN